MSKQKKVVVNKQFLNDLAKLIYDGKNKRFLRLCNGKLQNGPDPTNPQRPMHCGLGELYFALTGRQPEQDDVSESDVTALAADLSTLPPEVDEDDARDEIRREIIKKNVAGIKKLDVPKDIKQQLIDAAGDVDLDIEVEVNVARTNFVETLDDIPGVNDDGCADGSCSIEQYKDRSKRVAKQLRAAAKFLPK